MEYLGKVRKVPNLNIICCSDIYRIATIKDWETKNNGAKFLFSVSWWEQIKKFWRKNGV